EVLIEGRVEAEDNVENVHVLNKTSKHNTITNKEGHFRILAKLNDTLTLISLQHYQKDIVVNYDILDAKTLTVKLEERINQLNEVVLGRILSGNLEDDINNFDDPEEINFWDVGIPGYTGKPLTKSERLLKEASDFSPSLGGSLGGVGGSVGLNPIINAITGRTKMLKERVKLESQNDLLNGIIERLSESFLNNYPIEPDKQMEFFYFCAEDPEFENRCRGKSDIEVYLFLEEKFKEYSKNLESTKN
ncbi:MAG TPA: hypothetical protein VKZ97_05415, partial [Flavobacteriaceae bacterium]|nr:hypothetical protein [Flavobacteriaceae bacterium]